MALETPNNVLDEDLEGYRPFIGTVLLYVKELSFTTDMDETKVVSLH